MYKNYDYIIVGAGIAGVCTAYFLSKYSKSVLLIDKNDCLLSEASSAAGAFLSPLLGKENPFKALVSDSLDFSIDFYKEILKDDFINCGVCRVPKDENDKQKFEEYESFMDFEYEKTDKGYFFDIGSRITPKDFAQKIKNEFETLLNYKVFSLKQDEKLKWIINDELITSNLILATGHNVNLIKEDYLKIRPVWGQKIDILTSSINCINYHKECSVSSSSKHENNRHLISIGATHHRFNESSDLECKKLLKEIEEENNEKLLSLAQDIINLKDIEIIDIKVGARSCSVDYFPMLGELIDSKASIEKYPHLINGSFVTDDKLIKKKNLYIINGVGGRGFVLSPYLANSLVEFLINKKSINESILTNRLFKRWVKKIKLNNR